MSAANASAANIAVVRAICAILDELLPDADRPHERLIKFVADRPGHDLRYAIDDAKLPPRARLGAARDVRSRPRKTVAWYLDNRDLVGANPQRRLSRRAVGDGV